MGNNFLDKNGLGQIMLSIKQALGTGSIPTGTSTVNVITTEGTSNTLTIWIGTRGMESENLPDGTLKFYLKQ
jgi:hypothetical protein